MVRKEIIYVTKEDIQMPGLWVRDRSITCGSFGKCLRFPVTKKESFESLRLPLAKGSSTSNQAFLLRRKDVTALLGAQNRYALRLAGHQSPRHVLRDGTALLKVDRIIEVLVLWLFDDKLQISCDFLGGFEEYV